jgi:hypothetical protein
LSACARKRRWTKLLRTLFPRLIRFQSSSRSSWCHPRLVQGEYCLALHLGRAETFLRAGPPPAPRGRLCAFNRVNTVVLLLLAKGCNYQRREQIRSKLCPVPSNIRWNGDATCNGDGAACSNELPPPTTMRLGIRHIRVQVSLQLRDSQPTPRAQYRPLVQDLYGVI